MRIKYVPPPKDIIEIAFAKARKEAKKTAKGKNKLDSEKKQEEVRINTLEKVSEKYLYKTVSDAPDISKLPKYYQKLLKLMMDVDALKMSLAHIQKSAGLIKDLQRKSLSKLAGCQSLPLSKSIRREFYGRYVSILKKTKGSIEIINEGRKVFNKMPHIDFELKTIALAGYPNTGKSTLLSKMTDAKPEIASYPFTTKEVKLGYYTDKKYQKIQVIDTPGILDRPAKDRNNIEKQAELTIKELANIILFLVDPSETCGYDVEKQISLFEEIEKKSALPILLVATKKDLERKEMKIKPDIELHAENEEDIKNLKKMLVKKMY